MALKLHYPDFAFAGNKVTPDEVGWDQQYLVINPSISTNAVGTTAIAGTTSTTTLVLVNALADYPRSLAFSVRGSNNLGGTWNINGYDQFGNVISESATIAVAANGGTAQGAKVFSEVTSGSFSFATGGSVGNGTPELGFATAGTTTLFGLPAKLASTTDVKMIAGNFLGVGTQTVGTFVTGSAVAANVDTTYHAIKAPFNVPAGTCTYAVRYRPTYVVSDKTVKNSV